MSSLPLPRLLSGAAASSPRGDTASINTLLHHLRRLAASRRVTRFTDLLSAHPRAPRLPTPFLYSLLFQCLLPASPPGDVAILWHHHLSPLNPAPFSAADFLLHLCDAAAGTAELEAAFRRVRASPGQFLGRRCHRALVAAFCRGSPPNPQLAQQISAEMEESGQKPDELSRLAVLRALCRAGYVAAADAVLRRLVEGGRVELDLLLYETYLSGLCNAGKLREARKLFDEMRKKGGSSVSRSFWLPAGRRVIYQLQCSAAAADAVLGAYVEALCAAGRVADAEALLKETRMLVSGLEVSAYSAYVRALFSVGRVADAVAFFDLKRRRCRKGIVAIGDIAVAVATSLCDIGRVDDGLVILQEAVAGGFVPTATVWNKMLEHLWGQGREQEAKDLFVGVLFGTCGGHARPDASTYKVMIHGLLQDGDIMAAAALMQEMAAKGFTVGSDLHGAVAAWLHRSDMEAQSYEYLSWMVEEGVLPTYSAWEFFVDSMSEDV